MPAIRCATRLVLVVLLVETDVVIELVVVEDVELLVDVLVEVVREDDEVLVDVVVEVVLEDEVLLEDDEVVVREDDEVLVEDEEVLVEDDEVVVEVVTPRSSGTMWVGGSSRCSARAIVRPSSS
jgi:hypothetical protein